MKDIYSKFKENITDFNGNITHMSSSNGFLDIIKYLFEELKVDINSKNKSNSIPLLGYFKWSKRSNKIFIRKRCRYFN